MTHILPVKPEEAAGCLLKALPKRTRDILEKRFGLAKNAERQTLDAIGKKYGITRERVRQIEADGVARIKRSPEYTGLEGLFSALEGHFKARGMVIREDNLLQELGGSGRASNSVYFLLRLHAPPLKRLMEGDEYHTRWHFGNIHDETARKTLGQTVEKLRSIKKPVSKEELFRVLGMSVRPAAGESPADAVLSEWMSISKLISQNHFGEWGLTEFPEIKPRGVRDLSHMVMQRSGSPMHFSEVAGAIGKLIDKSVHVQTVHNELIKDSRFVLVGRGLYALKNWGYDSGTVKDVISKILSKHGPLNRERVAELVSAQRFVKPNTTFINLENKKLFKKLGDGRYALR